MSKSHKTRGITTITGIGRRLFAGLQGGDTLIEVVVAMLLLGLMILGLVPLFTWVHSHEIINTAKVTAYNLAESQIEAIKSTPYDQMGTQAVVNGDTLQGDPPGQFVQQSPQIKYSATPGVVYNMSTQIGYRPDPSRNTASDPTQVDFKEITVEVKAQIPGIVTALCPDIILNTGVTQEDQWGEMPGGNIYVVAENATVPSSDPNFYVGNMTVDLTGSTTTYQMLTDVASGDMPGKVLFASLDADTYTMNASDNNSGDGMVLLPPATSPYTSHSSQQSYNLSSYETHTLTFQVAQACALNLKFVDTDGNQVHFNGHITLSWPLQNTPPIIDQDVNGVTTYNIIDLWPLGRSWTDWSNWTNQGLGGYILTITPASGSISYPQGVNPSDVELSYPGTTITGTVNQQ